MLSLKPLGKKKGGERRGESGRGIGEKRKKASALSTA